MYQHLSYSSSAPRAVLCSGKVLIANSSVQLSEKLSQQEYATVNMVDFLEI